MLASCSMLHMLLARMVLCVDKPLEHNHKSRLHMSCQLVTHLVHLKVARCSGHGHKGQRATHFLREFLICLVLPFVSFAQMISHLQVKEACSARYSSKSLKIWMCNCRKSLLYSAFCFLVAFVRSGDLYQLWRERSLVRRVVGRQPCNVRFRPERPLRRQHITCATVCVQSKLLL